MKPILGVYLGWIPPHGDTWEPLYRTIRVAGGYQSDRTQLCAPAIERYPGLKRALTFYPEPFSLPFAIKRRTPLNRPDYERNARTLNLPYPNLDVLEYIGRTGGRFSGDPFTVCPIVEPNSDGMYSYEFGLWKVDRDVRDSLTENTKFEVIVQPGRSTILTAEDRRLGEFSDHFVYLGNTIFNINLVHIAEENFFTGGQIVISFDTSIDLCAIPSFALTSPEVAVV